MNRYIVFLTFGFLAFIFESPPSLDLYRYYLYANTFDVDVNLVSFALDNFRTNFDFIYYTSFLIVKKMGVPIELVNLMYVGLYYFFSVKNLELYCRSIRVAKSRYVKYIVIFMITSVGLYMILSISRNLAAITFFLIGLNFLIKQKKLFLVFWLLSVFTHTGMLIYIALFSLLYFFIPLPRFKNYKVIVISLVLSSIVLQRFVPFIANLISQLPFFDNYSRYLFYTDIIETSNVFNALGTIEIITYYYFTIIMFFGFFFLKTHTKLLWGAFGIFLFLILSFGFSVMFVQRSLMILLPFQGLLALSIYKDYKGNKLFMDLFTVIMTISILLFFGYLYSYREVEMF